MAITAIVLFGRGSIAITAGHSDVEMMTVTDPKHHK